MKKQKNKSSMLISDALAVLRAAAVDGLVDVKFCWELADEFNQFGRSQAKLGQEKPSPDGKDPLDIDDEPTAQGTQASGDDEAPIVQEITDQKAQKPKHCETPTSQKTQGQKDRIAALTVSNVAAAINHLAYQVGTLHGLNKTGVIKAMRLALHAWDITNFYPDNHFKAKNSP